MLIQVGLGAALSVCKDWIDHNHRWVTSMKIESGCSRELVNKNSYVFHRHDLETVFRKKRNRLSDIRKSNSSHSKCNQEAELLDMIPQPAFL